MSDKPYKRRVVTQEIVEAIRPKEEGESEEKKPEPEELPRSPRTWWNLFCAFFIGVAAPMLCIWMSWAAFPLLYHKDVLGGVKDFADCTILRYDSDLAMMVPTNETIEIAQVDHEIKLV